MLSINWSDVVSVLELIRPYLIAFGIIFVLAVIVILAVKKVQEPKRYLIRSQSRVAAAIALVVIVNLICTGPMSTLLTLVSGSGTITPETQETAEAFGRQIAEEGIVLLKMKKRFFRWRGSAGSTSIFRRMLHRSIIQTILRIMKISLQERIIWK